MRRRASLKVVAGLVGLAVIAVVAVLVLMLIAVPEKLTAKDIHIADPTRAVADARRLMQQGGEAPRRSDELPESLTLPGLKFAAVFPDHVSLVLRQELDWVAGVRIWSADSTRKHSDTPTGYKDVFRRPRSEYSLTWRMLR